MKQIERKGCILVIPLTIIILTVLAMVSIFAYAGQL